MPKRILAIRLQAMGDLVITLPYLQALRKSMPPSVQIDLLTRREVDPIPRNIHLFNNIFSIGGGRNHKKILLYSWLLLPVLLLRRYDVVIDLQNNIVSEIIRKALIPKAWSVFDRFSPIAAGESTRLTIEAIGLGTIQPDNQFKLLDESKAIGMLKRNGWNGSDELVVLNPAGFFQTRNWDIQHYARFARLWLERFPGARFLVLGTSLIETKAMILKKELGDRLINLVNQTSPLDAFAILQHARLVLSEDSGLMHMAWVSGIPTLVLFGGTRSARSRPLGEHSFFLDSSDLPCGNCMEAVCRFGDVHCLSRYSPELVFDHACALISKITSGQTA